MAGPQAGARAALTPARRALSGVRLLRLADALTPARGLVAAGHFPAASRPLALQNAETALAALAVAAARAAAAEAAPGPPGAWAGAAAAAALVAGDREATLAFLWAALVGVQLPALLDLRVLRSEVARVEGGAGVRAGRGAPPGCAAGDERMALLLRWAAAVCARSGLAVRSFATCFADGAALCLLVSFYLPWSLPAGQVWRAAGAAADGAGGPDPDPDGEASLEGAHLERSAWRCVTGGGGGPAAAARRAGVARNFALLDAALGRLGGVPALLTADACCEPGGPAEQARARPCMCPPAAQRTHAHERFCDIKLRARAHRGVERPARAAAALAARSAAQPPRGGGRTLRRGAAWRATGRAGARRRPAWRCPTLNHSSDVSPARAGGRRLYGLPGGAPAGGQLGGARRVCAAAPVAPPRRACARQGSRAPACRVRGGGGAAARRARVAVPAAPAARRGAARGAAGRRRACAGAPAPGEPISGAPHSSARGHPAAWPPRAGRGGRPSSARGCSGSRLIIRVEVSMLFITCLSTCRRQATLVHCLRLTRASLSSPVTCRLCMTCEPAPRRQALARGRIARARLAAAHAAATTLAAVVRGWLARRRVHDELVAPAVLAAGRSAKARLQAARCEALARHLASILTAMEQANLRSIQRPARNALKFCSSRRMVPGS